MRIERADLDSPAFIALLEEHRATMQATAPSESQHALDLAGLRQADVSVWTLNEGDVLLGCGALQRLDDAHAEIKSMRTARAHLRKGVARTMLQHLLAESRAAGFRRVSLETGSMAYFEPARRLYAAFGFVECAPFGKYVEDPNSTFMTLELLPPDAIAPKAAGSRP
jgi:putative acetyltransferase